jgi:hypothetical protein
MTRILGAAPFLFLAVGCSSATLNGTLTDGLTGKGIAEVRLVARATSDEAGMACMAFDATTDETGAFNFEGICGGSSYTLSIKDDSWWVPGLQEVPDGGVEGLALEGWRNSSGEALYKLTADSFDGLRTHADVSVEQIKGTEEKVRFPWSSIPGGLPVIGAGEWLVLTGSKTVSNVEILPLIESGQRKFGDGETWVTMEPWYYIGTRFTDDETFERVAAQIDASKVITKTSGDRAGKYIPGDAVAPGRYAVLAPDSKTVTLVDFGKAKPAPAEGGEGG